MFVLKTDRACTDTSLPILKRDSLLEGDNGGVLSLYDFASRYSYPAQAAPTNGLTVNNMTETGSGSIILQSGDAPTYAGRGIDFTGVTKAGNYLNGLASTCASIWGSANQYFMVMLYIKLPTLANWNADAALHEIFKCSPAGSAGKYTSGPEMLMIAQEATSSRLTFRRQTALGTFSGPTLVPNALDYGTVVQLAYWRDATGGYARLKSANGVILASTALATNNTQDFSALTPKFGVTAGFGSAAVGGTLNAAHQNAAKYRIYRMAIENLVISGRSAATVLDADYTRTVARGVFS